jgi:hypothetical protein
LKISPIFSKFLEIGRYPLPLRVDYIPAVQKNRTLVGFFNATNKEASKYL